MAKSKIIRPDGTLIEVNGSPEEIKKILELYAGHEGQKPTGESGKCKDKGGKKQTQMEEEEDIVMKIVQEIRDSDQSEKIEANILDQSSQVNRALLPLYVVKKYIGESVKLTSGDIYNVLNQLGIKMALPNVSRTLSKTASKYVIPDTRRRRGGKNSYILSHKGEKYFATLLEE